MNIISVYHCVAIWYNMIIYFCKKKIIYFSNQIDLQMFILDLSRILSPTSKQKPPCRPHSIADIINNLDYSTQITILNTILYTHK